MDNPIIIAHHIMWTAYGWWLPNDPRGSTSTEINTSRLAQLADIHFGRKHIQPASRNIREFYDQASKILQYPLLQFQPSEYQFISDCFHQTIQNHQYTCYACAIMPDHVHLIIRKHKDTAEEMIENFQVESKNILTKQKIREKDHPVWTQGGWKSFLDHPKDVHRTIKYVNDNPIKMRKPEQHWEWVTPYDNWPLHDEHSQLSPYVKKLKSAGLYTKEDEMRSIQFRKS